MAQSTFSPADRMGRTLAWSVERSYRPEAVSVLVDLRMAPAEFQTAETATLAGPQVARVIYPGMDLHDVLHVEPRGDGTFEVDVEIASRFSDVKVGRNPWE